MPFLNGPDRALERSYGCMYHGIELLEAESSLIVFRSTSCVRATAVTISIACTSCCACNIASLVAGMANLSEAGLSLSGDDDWEEGSMDRKTNKGAGRDTVVVLPVL